MQFTWITIFELIGTAVFALSGVLVAIQRRLDLFGVLVLALTTAVGGGIIRDLILGNTPPATFVNPIYCAVAAATALIAFLAYARFLRHLQKNERSQKRLNWLMAILDAVGLGIFTVVGVDVCLSTTAHPTAFLSVFVGVMTGVGGGILRDVLVRRTPIILRREIYASASLIGAILYYYIAPYLNHMVAVGISAAVIIVIRLISIHRDLQLPSVQPHRYVVKSDIEDNNTVI